jgi:hypothetical protein
LSPFDSLLVPTIGTMLYNYVYDAPRGSSTSKELEHVEEVRKEKAEKEFQQQVDCHLAIHPASQAARCELCGVETPNRYGTSSLGKYVFGYMCGKKSCKKLLNKRLDKEELLERMATLSVVQEAEDEDKKDMDEEEVRG